MRGAWPTGARSRPTVLREQPLARGLDFAMVGGRNLFGGEALHTIVNGSAPPRAVVENPWGLPAVALNNVSSSARMLHSFRFPAHGGNIADSGGVQYWHTIVVGVYPFSLAAPGAICGVPYDGSVFYDNWSNLAARQFEWTWNADGGMSAAMSYYNGTNWTSDVRNSSVTGIVTADRWQTLAWRKGGSGNANSLHIDFFRDGQRQGSTLTAGAAYGGPVVPINGYQTGAGSRLHLLGRGPNDTYNRPAYGLLAFALHWHRSLTDDELAFVMQEPGALFDGIRRRGTLIGLSGGTVHNGAATVTSAAGVSAVVTVRRRAAADVTAAVSQTGTPAAVRRAAGTVTVEPAAVPGVVVRRRAEAGPAAVVAVTATPATSGPRAAASTAATVTANVMVRRRASVTVGAAADARDPAVVVRRLAAAFADMAAVAAARIRVRRRASATVTAEATVTAVEAGGVPRARGFVGAAATAAARIRVRRRAGGTMTAAATVRGSPAGGLGPAVWRFRVRRRAIWWRRRWQSTT